MPNLTFRIETIRAERYMFEPVAQLSANMNVTLGKLEKASQGYSTTFLIRVEYVPPVASIEVRGGVQIVPVNDAERGELEKGAASGQPVPQLVATIFGYVLPILALLTREIGMPPPVPLPVPAPQQQEERKAATGYI